MFKTFQEFLTAKGLTMDQFNAKEESEKSNLLKEYNTELKEAFESATKGMVKSEELTALKTQMESMVKAEDFNTVKELAMKLETEIVALKEKPTNKEEAKPKTFFGAIKAAFEAKKEGWEAAGSKTQKEPFRVEVKAAVDMGLNNTVEAAGSESQISITRNTGIISAIRQRITRYLTGGVSVGNLSGSNKVMWMEELDEQGDPIFIGEGDQKTQLSVRYEERDMKARKIAVYGKVTTEMIRNLPSLINYIQNNLMKRVDIETENQLFTGDDTGDNLKGIVEYATAFTGGGLQAGADPTAADVIRGIALQVEKAHGMAGAVYVKPEILAEMDVEKGTDGHYVLPPFRSPGSGNTVAGIRLISTNAINDTDTPGVDFVGGDLSVVNVLFTDAMSIQIGLDGNDFINNKKTILVEQELVQFVSANDTQVLVKGDMETAKAAITSS